LLIHKETCIGENSTNRDLKDCFLHYGHMFVRIRKPLVPFL